MSKALRALLTTAMALALAGAIASGCGAKGINTGVADTQIEWAGYTMCFDLITNDQGLAVMGGDDYDGQALRICFRYIGDTDGFPSETLFDDIAENPFCLRDAAGLTYDARPGISNLRMVVSDGNVSIAESQLRFGISFDVPAQAAVEDFVLVVGDDEYALAPYVSPDYQEMFIDA